jgi:hypothetical protein
MSVGIYRVLCAGLDPAENDNISDRIKLKTKLVPDIRVVNYGDNFYQEYFSAIGGQSLDLAIVQNYALMGMFLAEMRREHIARYGSPPHCIDVRELTEPSEWKKQNDPPPPFISSENLGAKVITTDIEHLYLALDSLLDSFSPSRQEGRYSKKYNKIPTEFFAQPR